MRRPILPLPRRGPLRLPLHGRSNDTKESAAPAVDGNKKAQEAEKILPFAVHRATLDNGCACSSCRRRRRTRLVLVDRAHGLARRSRGGRHGLRALLRAHDVPRHGEAARREYDKIVNGMGADANAFTTDDFTAYHMSFAKDDLAKGRRDRGRPLPEPQVRPERSSRPSPGAGVRRIPQGPHEPVRGARGGRARAAFDKHTYKHTTIGLRGDIQRMPEQYEYSKSFFRRFYRPRTW
jgi:zinc protease